MIKRDYYLNRLISKKENGLIKIITGIRRCGKSYLLFELYKNYLNSIGIDDAHIIQIQLDKKTFEDYRNPNSLYEFILEKINETEKFYIFIDEIQLYPLSFSEYYEYAGGEKSDAWEEYMTYGGMPLCVLEKDEREKEKYLKDLFTKIYIADIKERLNQMAIIAPFDLTQSFFRNSLIELFAKTRTNYTPRKLKLSSSCNFKERYKLKDEEPLSALIDVILSSVGSLTNPHKLSNTLESVLHAKLSDHTVKKYMDYLEDAFIIKKADRYDVKGKKYLDFPSKYYVGDIGLRNARLNFRQQERTHIMENIIFNELVSRGYSVDVGVVQVSSTENRVQKKSNLEIDFIVNQGFNKIYIQSAFSIDDNGKKIQEIRPLLNSGDFFKKIVIVNGSQKKTADENGIIYIGVIPFLIEKDSLEK